MKLAICTITKKNLSIPANSCFLQVLLNSSLSHDIFLSLYLLPSPFSISSFFCFFSESTFPRATAAFFVALSRWRTPKNNQIIYHEWNFPLLLWFWWKINLSGYLVWSQKLPNHQFEWRQKLSRTVRGLICMIISLKPKASATRTLKTI